jgi:hypothetical protein
MRDWGGVAMAGGSRQSGHVPRRLAGATRKNLLRSQSITIVTQPAEGHKSKSQKAVSLLMILGAPAYFFSHGSDAAANEARHRIRAENSIETRLPGLLGGGKVELGKESWPSGGDDEHNVKMFADVIAFIHRVIEAKGLDPDSLDSDVRRRLAEYVFQNFDEASIEGWLNVHADQSSKVSLEDPWLSPVFTKLDQFTTQQDEGDRQLARDFRHISRDRGPTSHRNVGRFVRRSRAQEAPNHPHSHPSAAALASGTGARLEPNEQLTIAASVDIRVGEHFQCGVVYLTTKRVVWAAPAGQETSPLYTAVPLAAIRNAYPISPTQWLIDYGENDDFHSQLFAIPVGRSSATRSLAIQRVLQRVNAR